MAVDHFTKKVFEEKVLDKTNLNWQELGLVQGEYTYLVPIKNRSDVAIYIRSSVKVNGISAGVGEDSIRAHLLLTERKIHFGKTKRVHRQPGWNKRTLDLLRVLYRKARDMKSVKDYNCPECGKLQNIYTVKKKGKNQGRLFTFCFDCEENWHWLSPQEN